MTITVHFTDSTPHLQHFWSSRLYAVASTSGCPWYLHERHLATAAQLSQPHHRMQQHAVHFASQNPKQVTQFNKLQLSHQTFKDQTQSKQEKAMSVCGKQRIFNDFKKHKTSSFTQNYKSRVHSW